MHKSLLFLLGVTLFLNSLSQKTYKDAIKLNLSGLVVKNISVQYERKVSKRISLAIAYRNLPNGQVPFASSLKSQISNSSIDFDKMNVGSSAFTPEIRFYVSKKGAMRGFYMAPFASFAKYNTDFPLTFSNRIGIFSGSLKSTTGGLQFGSQFKLSSRFYLDWWIVGPNLGDGKGNVSLAATLNANEQTALKDQLANLQKNVPFSLIESYTVDSNGANLVLNGGWVGLRGLGFNLSFHF